MNSIMNKLVGLCSGVFCLETAHTVYFEIACEVSRLGDPLCSLFQRRGSKSYDTSNSVVRVEQRLTS